MDGRLGRAALMLAAGLAASASAAAGALDRESAAKEKYVEKNSPGGRRDLPFSHGRSFATLDGYLAHLRDHAGPIGQPWYREIRRGVYELVSSARPLVPEQEQETRLFTREQLMERFGFSR